MPLVTISLIVLCLLLFSGFALISGRVRWRKELKQHSISAEELHRELEAQSQLLVYDVRQPLDLLAYSEIIPGARRIAPKEVLADPNLIPRDQDVVVYCTCPSDETSRSVLERAMDLNFRRIRVLTGGLEAWKAKGYPTEPYTTPFHLDTPTQTAS